MRMVFSSRMDGAIKEQCSLSLLGKLRLTREIVTVTVGHVNLILQAEHGLIIILLQRIARQVLREFVYGKMMLMLRMAKAGAIIQRKWILEEIKSAAAIVRLVSFMVVRSRNAQIVLLNAIG